MVGKNRTISKAEYEKNRKEGDAAAAKFRREIIEEKGPKAVKGMHVDHKKPIAKGGHPEKKDNLQLIPKKANLKKGAK